MSKKYFCELCGDVVSENSFYSTNNISEKLCKKGIEQEKTSVTF
jgi:hypothetical protein